MSKKIYGKGLAKQLNDDCSAVIVGKITESEFTKKYGQDIHDVMMSNFGSRMHQMVMEAIAEDKKVTELESNVEFKKIRSGLGFFCAAFN